VVNFYLGSFKYDWVTEVDGDKTWHLVVKKDKEPLDLSGFKGSQSHEIKLFEKLLCAIYLRPYKIESCAELTCLTSLADYYCALPILSRTLDSALYISFDFVESIWCNPCEVFVAAAKLRNALLFRDCLICLTGPWSEPEYEGLLDPRLKKIARRSYAEIGVKVAHAERKITEHRFQEVVNGKRHVDKAYTSVALNNAPFREIEGIYLPSIYRDLSKSDSKERNFSFIPILRELLENKLVLGGRGNQLLGCGDLYDYFLCAEIKDEDLPWDSNEIDW
jgi:hypothetical protein